MLIKSPYDWSLMSERAGKRILARIDPATHDMVICEEWIEDANLEQARLERDRPALVSPDLRPLAVIPQSVENRAINEGWYHDAAAWRKWANDLDNRNLRTTDGTA